MVTYYFGSDFFSELLKSLKDNLEYIGKDSIDHELIIINDSPQQNEYNKLSKIIKESKIEKFSSVNLVSHTQNKGVTISRKDGLELSSGDMFHIIDQDDFLDKKTFKYILNKYEAKRDMRNKILVFNGCKVNNKKDIVKKGLFKHFNKNTLEKKINNLDAYFYGGNQIITPGMLFFDGSIINNIKKIYNDIFVPKEKFDGIDDFYLIVYLLKHNYYFIYTDMYFFNYRVHLNNQRDRTKALKRFLDTYNILVKDKKIEKNQGFEKRIKLIRDLDQKKFFKALKNIKTLIKYIKNIYF
ncbi:glycosyltransferase family A protein [Halanaerobium saccharolyticum]|uniref:glycosyltransferase family A protein n=1 Tax=Halanaerobium saccharolyticum TaxID=43595 RepID=UPI001FBACE70|nr:glycosyltransferase family A protein [Halanaerobium saccharolyticum]